MALWTIAEQQAIKPLDKNNTNKFGQLQLEVEANDIQKYLGFEFYQEVKRNLSSYSLLLEGGNYEKGGKTYTFSGLKTVCCFLLYARYVRSSYINDTFSGLVEHTGDGFQRISKDEIKNQEERYLEIAGTLWDECVDYLQTMQVPYFDKKTGRTFKIDSL